MLNKSMSDLENDYVHLFIKDPNEKDPIQYIRDQSSSESMDLSKQYIHEFVDYMLKRKDILEDLKNTLLNEFNPKDVWLDYYNSRLTQLIREIKLKRLHVN